CFDIEAYCPDLRCFRCHGHQCQLIFEVWVRTRQSVRPPDLWPSEARVSLEIVTSLSQALRTFELPCHEATSFHQDVCPWRFGADFGCLFCRQASLVSRLDFDAAAGCGSASLTDGRCEALQGLARPTFRPRVKRRRSI
ncbi:unnamed protein product, partial [Effrenium voratum]